MEILEILVDTAKSVFQVFVQIGKAIFSIFQVIFGLVLDVC